MRSHTGTAEKTSGVFNLCAGRNLHHLQSCDDEPGQREAIPLDQSVDSLALALTILHQGTAYMANDTQKIVNKAWNFAHVLRVDGLSYLAYTEQNSHGYRSNLGAVPESPRAKTWCGS